MQETGLVLRPFISGWLLATAALVVVALSVLGYRRTTRAVAPRFKLLLLGLRLGALLAVLLCLLRPSLQTTHYETIKRPLLLLIDTSRSMSEIHDTPTEVSRLEAVNQLLQDNQDRLDELAERYDLMKLAFARGLLDTDGHRDEQDVSYSAYGLALQQAFTEAANSQADAVVIIGDGAHNSGPPDPVDVAAALNEQGVPVYTVGVGQDEATSELRDVKVLGLSAPKTVFLFTSFPVRAQVHVRGCQGLQVTAQLNMPGLPPIQRVLSIGHSEETVSLEFQVTPEEIGEYKLTLHIDPVPDEMLDTNNTASTFVKVVSTGVRAGFFDVLRPESKFIARSLEKAQHVMLRRTLVLAGQQLPLERTEIDRYDVVLIGDLPYSAMLPSRVLELKRAVQEDGKGLIVLLTPTSGGPKGWGGTPVADLLPVRLDRGAGIAEGQREFRIAPEYADHPILALAPDPGATRNAWAEMAPLAGALVGPEPKRAAIVLARDQEGVPLLVVHRSGKGRVACLMADTTFRWSFTERDTQDYHRRFWRQLVTWAAGLEQQDTDRLRITLNKQEIRLDEKVKVSVTLTDDQGQPTRDAQLDLRVTDPQDQTRPLPYTFSRQEGAYVAEYAPAEPGDYLVIAEAEREGKPLGSDRSHFHASRTDLELENPAADLKLLRRMSAKAEDAGGRYYYYPQAGDLFKRLKERANPLKLTTRRRRDIWDTWLLFALFAACMGTEWALRKWKGLV